MTTHGRPATPLPDPTDVSVVVELDPDAFPGHPVRIHPSGQVPVWATVDEALALAVDLLTTAMQARDLAGPPVDELDA